MIIILDEKPEVYEKQSKKKLYCCLKENWLVKRLHNIGRHFSGKLRFRGLSS